MKEFKNKKINNLREIPMTKRELFEEIKNNLIEMEEEIVAKLCEKSLELNITAEETIQEGLIAGMEAVGQLYEEEEYFLPEVLICSDAMNAGIEILKPHLKGNASINKIRTVIGVVEGDTHDIGKNLVKIMLEAGGIEVYDLGRDVPLDNFVEKAREVEAHFIIMSTLMTTTMEGMKTVIEKLKAEGMRESVKVAIGGGPVSQRFATEIGADLYTKDANECVRSIKRISTMTEVA